MLRDSIELITLLTEAKRLLGMSTESPFSSVSPSQAMAILDREVAALKRYGRPTSKIELKLLFGPTGPIQEMSMTGGWSRKYMELASKFDAAVEKCE